jgi:hypothetical protein
MGSFPADSEHRRDLTQRKQHILPRSSHIHWPTISSRHLLIQKLLELFEQEPIPRHFQPAIAQHLAQFHHPLESNNIRRLSRACLFEL